MKPKDFYCEFIQNVPNKVYQQSKEKVDIEIQNRICDPFFEIRGISMPLEKKILKIMFFN